MGTMHATATEVADATIEIAYVGLGQRDRGRVTIDGLLGGDLML
jgi:hypothetical protein